jgi:hypothetical protein
MPSRPKVFMLSDADRKPVHGGPVLVEPDMRYRQMSMQRCSSSRLRLRRASPCQMRPLRHELPIDEAAGAIDMSRDELQHYVSKGGIPFRSTEYVDWVNLADVLAFDVPLQAQPQARQAKQGPETESARSAEPTDSAGVRPG